MALAFARGLAAAVFCAGLALGSGALCAQEIPAAPPAIVLARMSGDSTVPDGYSADVDLRAKMHSFPFIGAAVHGTSTYRRPGSYHYHLDNMPRLAAKFSDLSYDLGEPTTWPQRYDIAMAPQSTPDAPALLLVPKKPGLVTSLVIETDALHGRILKATWTRRDGGTIVLTQTFAEVGAAAVVTEQHAQIDIPHFRAELTALYTNIAIDTATVAGVPEH